MLVTPRCADPLYRRSVRVSMGTVFQVPWTRIDPWPGWASQALRDNGFTVAALALADAPCRLDELAADPPDRLALVLGTEGDGLPRRTLDGADLTVRIPMAGGVDSLNVAAASAVAFVGAALAADVVEQAEADGVPVFVRRARRHREAHGVPPAPRRRWPRCSGR